MRAFADRPTDTGPDGGGGIRDFGMANNLTFLANDLYPGRKIMVWAHNFHIRHDNPATTSRQPTMGQWIRERFRNELYTIGLYMDRGTAAQNNRVVYYHQPRPGELDGMGDGEYRIAAAVHGLSASSAR